MIHMAGGGLGGYRVLEAVGAVFGPVLCCPMGLILSVSPLFAPGLQAVYIVSAVLTVACRGGVKNL